MANAVGFHVTVIDPRQTFAHQDRFPDITVISDWPEDVLKVDVLIQTPLLSRLLAIPKLMMMPLILF